MKIFKSNNLQETVEIGTEIDPTVEVKTIQEKMTETEADIEETVEIEAEVETDLTQEMAEEINQDLDQVKGTLTIETHRCFKLENYLKKQGKRIGLHDEDDDVQETAQAV